MCGKRNVARLLAVASLLLLSSSCSRQQTPLQREQPRAALKLDLQAGRQNQGAPGREQTQPATPGTQGTESLASLDDPLSSSWRAMDQDLSRNLQSEFAELPGLLEASSASGNDPKGQATLFRLLQAADRAPNGRRPILLLAADRIGGQVFCAKEAGAVCDQLRAQFAERHLTFASDELAGGWFYRHDILWNLWDAYPQTPWGEYAFVLLLDHGWDTSGTCAKGSDQFREVIRRGDSFLGLRPSSPRRVEVTFLVAEAYETWWSLSRAKADENGDGAPNPERYQDGAAQAWEKAIQLYDAISKTEPKGDIAAAAQRALSLLRAGQDTQQRKFYCIYD